MLVEVLLQLLIGQVDAELLKVILLEALKAVDVQHAHQGGGCGVLPNGGVDLGHKPVKHPGVDGLGQRVTVVQRSLHINGTHNWACSAPAGLWHLLLAGMCTL